MKKIICLILCIVFIFCSCIITNAESTTDCLYEDRFIEEYVREKYEFEEVIHRYKEVFYHYDDNGEIDWCLIYATNSSASQQETVDLKIDDFIIFSGSIILPFVVGYAVYDVANDKFVDLIDNYDELSNYDGLFDVLRTVEHSFIVGDADLDGVLSVMDASIIQSAIAEKNFFTQSSYTDYRTHESSNYYDVDDDGEISVMDATAIQMKIAKK